MQTIKRFLAIATALGLGPTAPIAAYGDNHETEEAFDDGSEGRGWRFDIALGAGVAPDYEGADEYEAVPLFAARVRKDDYYLRLAGTKLQANVVPSRVIRAGPQLNYRFERDDVDDNKVDDLRKVDEAWEVGGFVSLRFREFAGTKITLGADVEASRDVAAGHNGWLVEVGGLLRFPIAEGWRMDVGAGGAWANSSFMDEYFSVDADNSRRSGLNEFEADAGLKNIGVNTSLDWALTDHWGISFRAAYDRLVGDAHKSPVVDRGSSDQFFGGALVGYRW